MSNGGNGSHELDRLIERALVEEGTSMTPAPDAWERLRERLDDSTTSAGSSPASRGWLLVAAAVVAGFGGLAATRLMLTGGEGEVRTAEPSVDAADDASSGTTLDVVSEGARPPSLLVVTEDGRLVRVDTDSGEVEALAGGSDDGLAIDNAAVGLDDTVLFSTCCEPAVGMTYRLEGDAEPTFVSYGYNPAFGPDGLTFSLVQPTGITLHDVDGNVTRTIDAGDHSGNVQSVAWSPQGDRLAVEVATGGPGGETQVLLLPVDATSLDEATPTQPDEGRWWAQPAYLADGTLLVAEHPLGQAADAADESSVLREVTRDGRTAAMTDPGAPPYRLTADRTGTSAIVVAPDGTAVVRGSTRAWYTLVPPADTVLTRAADLAW